MSIEDIITLEDNKEYLILDISSINQERYLYCVGIDEEERPTDEYQYFKEVVENGDTFLEKVEDEKVLKTIITLFTNDYLNDSIITNEEQDV